MSSRFTLFLHLFTRFNNSKCVSVCSQYGSKNANSSIEGIS